MFREDLFLYNCLQLANTIYPSYDPIYKEISKSKTGYVGSMKKKRTYASGPRYVWLGIHCWPLWWPQRLAWSQKCLIGEI